MLFTKHVRRHLFFLVILSMSIPLSLVTTPTPAVAEHFPYPLDDYTKEMIEKVDTSELMHAAQGLKGYSFNEDLNSFIANDENEALAISSALDNFETAVRNFSARPVELQSGLQTAVVYTSANPANFRSSDIRATGGVYNLAADDRTEQDNAKKGLFQDEVKKQKEEQETNKEDGPNWVTVKIIEFIAGIIVGIERWFGIHDLVSLVFNKDQDGQNTENGIGPLPLILNELTETFFKQFRLMIAAAAAIAIAWSGAKLIMARQKESPGEVELALEGLYKTLGVSVFLTLLPEILRVLNLLMTALVQGVAILIKSATGLDPYEYTFHTILFGGALSEPKTIAEVTLLATAGSQFLIVLLVIFIFDLIFTYMYTVRFLKLVYMLILIPYRLVTFLIFPEKIEELRSFAAEFIGTLMLPFVHALGLFAFFMVWSSDLKKIAPTSLILLIIFSMAALMKFGSEASRLLGSFFAGAGTVSRSGEQFAGGMAQVAGTAAGAVAGGIAGGLIGGAKMLGGQMLGQIKGVAQTVTQTVGKGTGKGTQVGDFSGFASADLASSNPAQSDNFQGFDPKNPSAGDPQVSKGSASFESSSDYQEKRYIGDFSGFASADLASSNPAQSNISHDFDTKNPSAGDVQIPKESASFESSLANQNQYTSQKPTKQQKSWSSLKNRAGRMANHAWSGLKNTSLQVLDHIPPLTQGFTHAVVASMITGEPLSFDEAYERYTLRKERMEFYRSNLSQRDFKPWSSTNPMPTTEDSSLYPPSHSPESYPNSSPTVNYQGNMNLTGNYPERNDQSNIYLQNEMMMSNDAITQPDTVKVKSDFPHKNVQGVKNLDQKKELSNHSFVTNRSTIYNRFSSNKTRKSDSYDASRPENI